ncbi:MAG: hypothetical protein ACKOF9_02420 [Burkholderiales bacterium]
MFVAPVGALAEGLLNVDEQQGGLYEELLVLKVFTVETSCRSVAPDSDRNQSNSDIDSDARSRHYREVGNPERSRITPTLFQAHPPTGFPPSRE